MREDYLSKHHRLEQNHWFLKMRRDLLKKILKSFSFEKKILEVGCSSGVLLKELSDYGFREVYGVEINEKALSIAKKTGISNVFLIDGSHFPFNNDTFDFLISSDVLEHIKDEDIALKEWLRVLKPGGRLIILVPAFNALWSDHDVVNNHFRRYTKNTLAKSLTRNGFVPERFLYWNFTLFLPVAFLRLVMRILPKSKSTPQDQLYEFRSFTSRILELILGIENYLIEKGVNFPFGVSVMAIVKKIES